MLVVNIEMHSAVTGKVSTLGRMIIANDGMSDNPKRADYDVMVGKKTDAENTLKVFMSPLRRGRVENYPRLSYNVWRLVLRALRAAFPEEKQ